MRVHDYQAIKFIQTLLLDPKYHNAAWLQEKHVNTARWKTIEIIKQVRANFPLFLKEAKLLVVDEVLNKVINDEELFKKFKPKT